MAELKAAVGMSRKWDAYEAGREVARDTLDRLGKKPDFFLLFCTIHYRDHGGFKKFLKGIWEVLPEGTSLVGGTVTGFINPRGCFTRGASALAVSYPNMDVALGCGEDCKREPAKAAESCAKTIKGCLAKSKYKNRFLFNIISGPVTLKIPGLGREDEIFEEITKKLPDYKMILGTSMDNKGFTNYQFLQDKVLTNSVIALGLRTDLDIGVCTTHGTKRSDIKFEITKLSREGHIIQEINNKPAAPELYRLLNWPKSFLNNKYRILYYPLELKRHGKEVPTVIALILDDFIVTPYKVESGEVWVLRVSGKNLLDAMKDNLKSFDKMQPEFGLFSTCITILQTFGHHMNIIKKNMLDYFKDKAFLMIFCAGQGTYSPEEGITYANMSYNTAMFGHKV